MASSARWRSSSGPIRYVGKLVFFRVYSGQLNKGDIIYNPRTRKRERVSRVMMIPGRQTHRHRYRYSGDIAALVASRTSPRATRSATRISTMPARAAHLPGARHLHGDRAQDQGRPREDGRSACSAWPRKIRPSAFHQRGHRPDDHRRHGRAAPGNHPRPPVREFKVEANAGTPQIAYRETITKSAEAKASSSAVRRPRPIRPCLVNVAPERARQGRRHREQDCRRHHSEGIHPGGHRTASKKPC